MPLQRSSNVVCLIHGAIKTLQELMDASTHGVKTWYWMRRPLRMENRKNVSNPNPVLVRLIHRQQTRVGRMKQWPSSIANVNNGRYRCLTVNVLSPQI